MRLKVSTSGFTMVELLLSLGLFSMLLIGLLQLLDTSTDLWKRVEKQRERTEVASAFAARLERDFSTLEPGPEGDLLADWVLVDVNGDGLTGMALARLRFVRRASARELARLEASTQDPDGAADDELLDLDGVEWKRLERGLVEVAWALVPSNSKVFDGRLLRGQRSLGDTERMSLFEPNVFGANGQPVAGLFEELATGVLWMDMAFATSMTITDPVPDGSRRWRIGDLPTDGGSSWDAWRRGRLDAELIDLNVVPAGLPQATDLPLLPRRIRIVFEVQSERERSRRTELVSDLDQTTSSFLVIDGRRLPKPGGFVLIDEEWMEVLAVRGERLTTLRGQRGTLATGHRSGAKLWYGWRTEIELPLGMAREEWGL